MTEQNQTKATPQDAMKKTMGYQFGSMIIMLIMLFIISNPSLRNLIGGGMNTVLLPAIGFNYSYPTLTLMLSGILIGVITSIPRYFFTDWLTMGKAQHRQRAFNQVMREAYRNNQRDKIQKLNKMRTDMMMQQQQVQMNTMKPLMVLSVFTLLIFTWMYVFIANLSFKVIAFPWNHNINIQTSHLWIMPYWIVIYFLASLVVGYFITMIIKYFDFSYKLRSYEREEQA